MSSALAELPDLIGFFSYSREDDEDSDGSLSALRERIQRELRGQLGRSTKTFRLWQDKEAIAAGTLWEAEITTAVTQSSFFIPIITPTVVRSPYCRFELDSFLAREAALGRNDLVFPILYIKVAELEDSERRKNDPVLSIIAKRQYLDWREFRHRDISSTEVREAVARFCANICEALNRPWLSPDERRAREAGEAERQRQETEVERAAVPRKKAEEALARERAEEERRRREAETARQKEEQYLGSEGQATDDARWEARAWLIFRASILVVAALGASVIGGRTGESIVIILIVGLISGWLVSKIVGGAGTKLGLFGDMMLGIIGGSITSYVLPRIGFILVGGIIGATINAIIGAMALQWIVRLFRTSVANRAP